MLQREALCMVREGFKEDEKEEGGERKRKEGIRNVQGRLLR